MKKILVVTGLIGLAGALILGAVIWKSVREQQKLMAALKAGGYATTLADLDPPFEPLPTELNAAAYFEAAGRVQTLCTEPLPKLSEDATTPLSEDQMGVLVRWLEANGTALDYLHKGAVLEKSQYSFSYGAGTGNLLAVRDVALSADLLHWEAMCRAERGDSEGAVESILATLRLGRSLVPYPVLAATTYRYDCCDKALVALRRSLNRTTFSEPQLARLASALAESERDVKPSLARMIAATRVCYLSDHSLPIWAAARYHFSVGKLVIAAEAPPEKRAAALSAAMPSGPGFLTRDVLVTCEFIEDWQEIDLKQLAELRTALARVAIERYHLAHGLWPDLLESLAPAYLESVPADPYDGQHLRYKHDDQGCVVYSIGVKGADENGTPGRVSTGGNGSRLH